MKPARTRKSKFRKSDPARRTVNGIVFASIAESKRYVQLRLLEMAREISGLTKGQKRDLIVNGKRVGSYTPDFEYLSKTGDLIIEEVKSGTSGKQADYRLRKKVFEASTNLTVTEINM